MKERVTLFPLYSCAGGQVIELNPEGYDEDTLEGSGP